MTTLATRLTRGIAVLATFTTVQSTSAAVAIDFTGGAPAGATVVGNSLIVGAYRFTGDGGPVPVGFIGNYHGINFGYGLMAPGLIPTVNSVTVSRVDGQTFTLDRIDPFVGNILVGGLADFELTPFDAGGNELDPVVMPAGQFWSSVAVYPAWYPTLSGISSFRIARSGVDHYTGFAFSSVADVPEAGTAAMLGAGLSLLLLLRRRR